MNGTGTCTVTYALTQEDVDQAGVSLEASGTAESANGTQATSVVSTAAAYKGTPTATLKLEKTATPPSDFAAGNDVAYSFTVTNTGDATLTSLAIDDSNGFGGTGTPPDVTCFAEKLAPNASTTCSGTYKLTQDDVNNEGFINHASAKATALAGTDSSFTVNSSTDAAFTGVPASKLILTKTVSMATGETFEVGGNVAYVFNLTNSGDSTLTLDSSDPGNIIQEMDFTGRAPEGLVVDCSAVETPLEPGKTTQCTGTYTLTQADVDADEVTNTATASATFDSKPVTAAGSGALLQGTAVGGLTVVPTATAPATWATGEEVSINVKVINSGQVDINNPSVELSGFTGATPSATCPATAALAPGASIDCTATY